MKTKIGIIIASILTSTGALADGGVDSTGAAALMDNMVYTPYQPEPPPTQNLNIPICAAGQVLTNTGGVMSCVTGNSIIKYTASGYKISDVTGLPISHPVISTQQFKMLGAPYYLKGEAYTDSNGMPWIRYWNSQSGWSGWLKSFTISFFEARPAGLTFSNSGYTPATQIVAW